MTRNNLIIIIMLFSLFPVKQAIGGTSIATATKNIAMVLDKLHLAAERADSQNYFATFSDSAIYIGTDASEHWDMTSFRAFVEPYFKQGKGWQYRPQKRHIYVDKTKQFAWFDEILVNPKYGITRSTGALVKENGMWKIVQYHLTIPIPNALASDVVRQIKASQKTSNK